MKIENNCIVSISFRLTNNDGDLLDESAEGQPLVYLHGGAGILPTLEDALTGKSAGNEFDVTIEPEFGFGAHLPDLVQRLPLSAAPTGFKPELGMQIQAELSLGGEQTGVITGIDDDVLTIDFNHPLAGMTLHFRGNVEDVRVATEAEIEAGGPGV